MKICIYSHNIKWGFYAHNNQVVDFAVLFDSGAIYDNRMFAEIAADVWLRQDVTP